MEFKYNYQNEVKQGKLDKIYCIVFYCGYLYYVFDLQSSLVFKKRRKLQLLLPLSRLSTLIALNLVIARVFKCIYTAFGLESEVSFYPVIESLEKKLRNRSSSA